MARIVIDKTGNDHADRTFAHIDDNFKDIYAGNVSTGPTGATGATGPTGPAVGTHSGTFTNNGTSTVTTADTNVTANSAIVITLKTVGGTVGAIPHLLTITPTTGFATVGTASDTSVYNYTIIG